MCEHGNTRPVYVKIPADLSCTSEERWKHAQIDSCIADIVEALQQGDIDMRGSCCGHGKRFGNIQLQDGRVLLILTPGSFSYDWVKTRGGMRSDLGSVPNSQGGIGG